MSLKLNGCVNPFSSQGHINCKDGWGGTDQQSCLEEALWVTELPTHCAGSSRTPTFMNCHPCWGGLLCLLRKGVTQGLSIALVLRGPEVLSVYSLAAAPKEMAGPVQLGMDIMLDSLWRRWESDIFSRDLYTAKGRKHLSTAWFCYTLEANSWLDAEVAWR